MSDPPQPEEKPLPTARSLDGECDSPASVWRQTFGSVFTPGWSLGLLLFLSAFLPFYKGCRGETVYVGPYVRPFIEEGRVTLPFLCTWGFLFGLVVAVGLFALATTRDSRSAAWLWGGLAVLVLALGCVLFPWGILLLLLLPLTALRSRSWFNAAMWLQLALAITAAFWYSVFTPLFMLGERPLVGGILAVACSLFLVVATVALRIDGERALTRRRAEPGLRLTTRSTFLLWSLGCLAFCWSAGFSMATWNWSGFRAEKLTLHRVHGTVTLDGRPLANARITLYEQTDQPRPRLPFAISDAGGKFEILTQRSGGDVKGTAAARYKVTVRPEPPKTSPQTPEADMREYMKKIQAQGTKVSKTAPALKSDIPLRFQRLSATPLVIDVSSDSRLSISLRRNGTGTVRPAAKR